MSPLAPRLNDQGDWVCEHGTAMDVHCCYCHNGFIFEDDHVCQVDPARAATCDHEFADTTFCVKCGWTPPPREHQPWCQILQPSLLMAGDGPNRCTCGLTS